MASIQNKNSYEGKSGQEVYEAAIQAITNAGYKVWKRRDIARLVMGVGQVEGQEVRFNMAVSMVDNSVTTSVEADSLSDESLQAIAQKLTAEMGKLLA